VHEAPAFAWGPEKGWTTWGLCTQPFPAIFARGCFHDLNVIRSLILFILVFFRYLTLTDPHCRYALSKDRPLYFVNKPNVLWCCSSLPHVKDNCTPAPKQSRVLELIIYSMCRVITVQFNMHAYSLRTKLTIKLVKKIWIICHKSIPLITLFGYEPNDIILKVCVYPYITKSELGM
jgi:hypothetical protein